MSFGLDPRAEDRVQITVVHGCTPVQGRLGPEGGDEGFRYGDMEKQCSVWNSQCTQHIALCGVYLSASNGAREAGTVSSRFCR
jgi:hypothetical protein